MIHGRETGYMFSKIIGDPIIGVLYPHLVQIMEPQIVSECLRFGTAEVTLLFFASEAS